MKNFNWKPICQHIEQVTHQPFAISAIQSVSGGCINQAFIIESSTHSYFVKLNQASLVNMFAAEFAGLEEIVQTATIKAPRPISYGVTEQQAFLIMEMVQFGSGNTQSEQKMGQQLAAMHQIEQPYFGWQQDNTIGSTPQINTRNDHWIEFWHTQRLNFQLSLAEQNGYSTTLISKGQQLSDSLACFFSDYTPKSSLLHGDLWGGNAAISQTGEPVIFDPACYYGDREADLAMTELFGGFSPTFYAAYQESSPLDAGYRTRKTLYNLYHILNHLNLFGSGYQRQAEQMLDSLLAEIR